MEINCHTNTNKTSAVLDTMESMYQRFNWNELNKYTASFRPPNVLINPYLELSFKLPLKITFAFFSEKCIYQTFHSQWWHFIYAEQYKIRLESQLNASLVFTKCFCLIQYPCYLAPPYWWSIFLYLKLCWLLYWDIHVHTHPTVGTRKTTQKDTTNVFGIINPHSFSRDSFAS